MRLSKFDIPYLAGIGFFLLVIIVGGIAACEEAQETPQAIERKIGKTGYALRGSIVTLDTFVEFRHLEPDATYWFTVKAFNEFGMSGPSDTVWIYIDPNGKGHVLKGNPSLDHEEDNDA